VKKTEAFPRTKFPPSAFNDALDALTNDAGLKTWPFGADRYVSLATGDRWSHDTDEEFFADYRKNEMLSARYYAMGEGHALTVDFYRGTTEVSVEAPDRARIERVFAIFENAADGAQLPEPPPEPEPPREPPTIFIGHGRDNQWRDLKDHLHEKHGFPVEAYEIGARAGHTIRDILDDMLTASSFALLVFTGEDEDSAGRLHPRDNVIHEAGLFQGQLGWARAIILLEDGTVEFSNIHGIQQIRFSRGHIASTFGDVVATVNREFPNR
jgi:hypothetical protein